MGVNIGVLAALASALLFALAPIFYGFAMKKFKPLEANFIRTLLTYPFCLLLLLLIKGSFNLDISGISYAFIVALTGSVVGDTSFIGSIKYVGASLATALSYTYIVFTVFMAVFIVSESLKVIHVLCLILVLTGIWICYFEVKGKVNRLGVLLSIITAISWSIAIISSKFALKYMSPVELMVLRNGFALVLLSPIIFKNKNHASLFRGRHTIYLVLGALSGIVFGIQLYYFAVKTVGVILTTIITGSSPVLTLALAYILLRERLSKRQLIGVILAIIGSYLASLTR